MDSEIPVRVPDDRYFVLHLNRDGEVERVSSLVCTSDAAALLWGGRLENGKSFEVWTSAGCIGRVPDIEAAAS